MERGSSVRHYRFCLFDQSGEALFAFGFECPDDGSARGLLKQQLSAFPNAHGFELWELNRLVQAGITENYRSKVYALPQTQPSDNDDVFWSEDGPAEYKISAPPSLNLRSERLRAAYAYWLGKCKGRLMPSRSDIDPTDIPKLLPYVTLIDVLADPLDFRYRLIGTETRNISRRDYTGLRFSEIEGRGRDSVLWRGCEAVAHSKAPISDSPPYVGSDVFLRDCENVMLPLSDDLINVMMILKVISFVRGHNRPSSVARA
jgi:hypothetical protein